MSQSNLKLKDPRIFKDTEHLVYFCSTRGCSAREDSIDVFTKKCKRCRLALKARCKYCSAEFDAFNADSHIQTCPVKLSGSTAGLLSASIDSVEKSKPESTTIVAKEATPRSARVSSALNSARSETVSSTAPSSLNSSSVLSESVEVQEENQALENNLLSRLLAASGVDVVREEDGQLDNLLAFHGSETIQLTTTSLPEQPLNIKRTLLSVNPKNVIAEESVVPIRLLDYENVALKLGITPVTTQITISYKASLLQVRYGQVVQLSSVSSHASSVYVADPSQFLTIAAPRVSDVALLVIRFTKYDETTGQALSSALIPFIVTKNDAVIQLRQELMQLQSPGVVRRFARFLRRPAGIATIHVVAGTAIYLAHKKHITTAFQGYVSEITAKLGL